MGNSFHLHILKKSCIRLPQCVDRKDLQVVKMDGNIIRLQEPLLVRELLADHQGFGLKSSRDSPNLLPPSFELQLGRTYYLLPAKIQPGVKIDAAESNTAAVKRIKVVISKQQLQELLAKKTSLENLVIGMDSSTPNWKPSLSSIPEETESISPI
ncbi:uncharacterized protein LOC127259293 [Andrographis paniculata]|uniref:uncharacterized protein LOC127259293 n=1 Tax=Andrographis paniculata TaxID=175694 RepID=UPI0021E807B1|nr:uncharacterized protein LOC127259293 [Andrographis paniculata]